LNYYDREIINGNRLGSNRTMSKHPELYLEAYRFIMEMNKRPNLHNYAHQSSFGSKKVRSDSSITKRPISASKLLSSKKRFRLDSSISKQPSVPNPSSIQKLSSKSSAAKKNKRAKVIEDSSDTDSCKSSSSFNIFEDTKFGNK
jgi:hypothetical protein